MTDFLNITSNDNWFKQHPEKIAGVEYETTSFFFPIMVKGTKEDVLRVTGFNKSNKRKATAFRYLDGSYGIKMTDGKSYNGSQDNTYASYKLKSDAVKAINKDPNLLYEDKSKKLAIAKAKAKAILILLDLGGQLEV
jgi:hypothetical protein